MDHRLKYSLKKRRAVRVTITEMKCRVERNLILDCHLSRNFQWRFQIQTFSFCSGANWPHKHSWSMETEESFLCSFSRRSSILWSLKKDLKLSENHWIMHWLWKVLHAAATEPFFLNSQFLLIFSTSLTKSLFWFEDHILPWFKCLCWIKFPWFIIIALHFKIVANLI